MTTVNVVEEMDFIAAGSKKMEVKWEPFRDIFENIIRPIGGENDVATMVRNLQDQRVDGKLENEYEFQLENVKEEDIDTLEGTLLDKAKDDPEFVEQILTHLIHVSLFCVLRKKCLKWYFQIRERYIKLRQDWQKTIEDRDKTAKIFKVYSCSQRYFSFSFLLRPESWILDPIPPRPSFHPMGNLYNSPNHSHLTRDSQMYPLF